MKGSYQYGFFKRLYEVVPDFKINKMYASSVGALNAVPIIIRKPYLLDKHWNRKEVLPFDTIAVDWDGVTSENSQYRNVQRARAFIKNGSIFKALDTRPCYDLMDCLDDEELKHVENNLLILCFDTKKEKVVYRKCRNKDEIVEAIRFSTMFPGLFTVDSHIVDGAFGINLDSIIQSKKNAQWLCIDLQGTLKGACYPSNIQVFSPKIIEKPIMNITSCLLVDRTMIDDLIENGMQDADVYVKRLMDA